MATELEVLEDILVELKAMRKNQEDTLETVDVDKNVMRVMNRRNLTDVELSDTFADNSATNTHTLSTDCIAVTLFVDTGVDGFVSFTIAGKTIQISERDGKSTFILPAFTSISVNNPDLLEYRIMTFK